MSASPDLEKQPLVIMAPPSGGGGGIGGCGSMGCIICIVVALGIFGLVFYLFYHFVSSFANLFNPLSWFTNIFGTGASTITNPIGDITSGLGSLGNLIP